MSKAMSKAFLAQLLEIESDRRALTVLFNWVLDQSCVGDFAACDALLVELQEAPFNLQLGALSITVANKDKLPARAQLLQVVKENLRKERGGEEAVELLQGLE
jgi:hypothetical protein